MPTSPRMSAAIELAKREWPVFAVGRDKKPFARTHGVLDATTDEASITSMWRAYPRANVAVACGGTGPTVIDMDIDRAKGIDGAQSLASLQSQLGPLPETLISRTPRDGRHHFFSSPPGPSIKCSAGKLAPGIDVRAGGGYVLVPPSVVDGAPYEWLNDAPLAALPERWLEALAATRGTSITLTKASEIRG